MVGRQARCWTGARPIQKVSGVRGKKAEREKVEVPFESHEFCVGDRNVMPRFLDARMLVVDSTLGDCDWRRPWADLLPTY